MNLSASLHAGHRFSFAGGGGGGIGGGVDCTGGGSVGGSDCVCACGGTPCVFCG